MKYIRKKDVERLLNNPIGFAMMIDKSQLEQVIVTFVSILNDRQMGRGGKNER